MAYSVAVMRFRLEKAFFAVADFSTIQRHSSPTRSDSRKTPGTDDMRIFLTGIGCVGKTTIGPILSSRLGYRFFDLDEEIERFFGTSIERLQNKFLTIHSYRNEASTALVHILSQPNSQDCVIALPPSGLMGGFLRVVKKAAGMSVVLTDTPENILNRITFYDIDSRLIEKRLTQKEKHLCLREIKKDIAYFRKTYDRADMEVDISGLDAQYSAEKVERSIEAFLRKEHVPRTRKSEQSSPPDRRR